MSTRPSVRVPNRAETPPTTRIDAVLAAGLKHYATIGVKTPEPKEPKALFTQKIQKPERKEPVAPKAASGGGKEIPSKLRPFVQELYEFDDEYENVVFPAGSAEAIRQERDTRVLEEAIAAGFKHLPGSGTPETILLTTAVTINHIFVEFTADLPDGDPLKLKREVADNFSRAVDMAIPFFDAAYELEVKELEKQGVFVESLPYEVDRPPSPTTPSTRRDSMRECCRTPTKQMELSKDESDDDIPARQRPPVDPMNVGATIPSLEKTVLSSAATESFWGDDVDETQRRREVYNEPEYTTLVAEYFVKLVLFPTPVLQEIGRAHV